MSSLSNDQGRAYEYVCLQTLNREVNKIRKSEIVENSSLEADKRTWGNMTKEFRAILTLSAEAAVKKILELEPNLTEQTDDIVQMFLQKDEKGEEGDVRDIVVTRKDIRWEIGLSIKHNHHAVKHNRLSPKLDFGEKWYGVKCSQTYWDKVSPIFDFLKEQKQKSVLFEDIRNKDEVVYIPLLEAFIEEIRMQAKAHKELPKKIVEFLLGEFDFYKVVSVDKKQQTNIETYNLHGNLNKPSETRKSAISVPLVNLPTRLALIEMKPNSTTTAEMYFDEGWQFSFRIHNAEKVATPSLKFDIQLVGVPTTILSITCNWQ